MIVKLKKKKEQVPNSIALNKQSANKQSAPQQSYSRSMPKKEAVSKRVSAQRQAATQPIRTNAYSQNRQSSNWKWYSGATPTARETYAQMYRTANGDRAKFEELEGLYAQERATIGSPIYNPYTEATNYKAIQGLADLGIDMSGGVTQEWLNQNIGLLGDKRTTATGYNAAAPTKKSSAAENAAYWYQTLYNAEERTQAAETENAQLAADIKYWVDRGYSDKAIIEKIRRDFDSNYKTLSKMDEERNAGSALILNRPIDYSGDDTLYGMIWAARNNDQSGDYFTDAVRYTLGQGNKYQYNAASEAARDPSNYEGYHPYSMGSTVEDWNKLTGLNRIDDETLEANRGMLSGTDAQVKAWQNAFEANENSKQATEQLAALDEWTQKQIERGKSADEIIAMLDSYIDPADGKPDSDYATLAKMEKARKMGSYISMGDSIDFTLPQYREKIRAAVQQRDAEAAQAAEEQAIKDGAASGWSAFWTGSVGEESDKVLKSKNPDAKGSLHEYMRENYGVDADDFTYEELEKWSAAREATRAAKDKPSQEARENAEMLSNEAMKMAKGIAESDRAHEYKEETQPAPETAAQTNVDTSLLADVVPEAAAHAYDPKKSVAYASVYGDGSEPREGMADMNATPQRYEIGAGGGGAPEVKRGSEDATPRSPESEAYMAMCSGGQWDSTAYRWAMNRSTNPDGLRAELINGIEQIRRGNISPDEAGLAGSWYNEFEHLFSGYDTQWVATNSIMGASRRAYDPRDDYGEALGGALKSAASAFNNGDNGALTEDEYTGIMLDLSRMAEIVDGVSEDVGQRGGATSDMLVQELNLTGAIADVQARIDSAVQQKNTEDAQLAEAGYSSTRNALTAMFDGEIDQEQQATLAQAQYTEISEAAKDDAVYGEMQNAINLSLNYNTLADRGYIPNARYGLEADTEITAKADAYASGVKALARAKLDQDMKYATAAGMTLEEYYQAYPKAAKTGESLIADAEREYNEAWGVDFKGSVQAILEVNMRIAQGEAPQAETTAQEQSAKEDGEIGVYGDIALGIDQGMRGIDKGLLAIVNNLSEPEVNSPATREILIKQYDGDAKKRRSDLLEMVEAMPDVPYKEELRARIETTPDIWSIGDNKLSTWSRGQIQAADADMQAIGELVERYGTSADKYVMQAASGVASSTTLMAGSALASAGFVPFLGEGLGNLAGSIVAAIPEGSEMTYDLRDQGVDADAAFYAGLAYTIFSGATEDLMDIGYNASAKGRYAMREMFNEGFWHTWRTNPKIAARASAAILASFAGNALGEGTQEAVQSLGGSMLKNIATGKPLLSESDFEAALGEGIAALPSSAILGFAGGGYIEANPYIDEHGNMLSYAEAKAMPDFDGTVANNVIEHQTTQQAVQDASADLNALIQSSEYQTVQQTQAEADTAMQQAQQAEAEAQNTRQRERALSDQLQTATDEMLAADVVTEEMTDNIAALSEALPEATNARIEAERKAAELTAAAAEVSQRAEATASAIQAQYTQIMETAKSNARQFVLDRFFHGATSEQRAAYESYLEKTAELTEAKSQLRNAKIAAEKYGAIAASKYGSAAQTAYGRALNIVDRLSDEVAALNEQADALYDAKYEAIPDVETDAEFARTEARSYAEKAAQEAQADPMNVRKQMAADLAAKRLQSETAAAELAGKTADIAARLESRDSATRQAALTEYKTLLDQANTTAQATEAAQQQYAATDRTQTELNEAITDFKQYTNTDLTVDGAPKHDAAVAAYERLQNALRDADIADAQNELARVTELLTADDADTQQAFTEAGNRLNELLQAKDSYTGETSAARQAAVATALQTGGLEQLQQAINSRERAEVVQTLNSIAAESQENARALRTLAGMQATTAQLTVKGDTGATGQPGLTRAYAESSVKLNGDQKTQMQILDAFAKDSNIEIVVHPSVSTVEGAVNGAYIEGNVIHIGLDAIDQGYVQAGFHEAVHWIAQNAQTNPDAYSGLEQTVFDALRENGADVDSLVRQRIEQYAQNGVNISEQAAREEIVAESCGMVLTDEANMLKFAQEHKPAFRAVMDRFIQFWEKLKSIAASIGNKNQRTEMQTLLGKDSALQKIYDNFMAAAKETGTLMQARLSEASGMNSIRDFEGQNEEAKYSLNQVGTDAFKNWFGDWQNDPENASKVVNEDGTPKVVYHGTARADRVGWEFRPDRATSGPMAFFTDSEEIANNYARDKSDTSLAYEDGDGSYRQQFRVKIENQWGSRDIPIAQAWGYLPMDVRKDIEKRAGHITFDDDADQIIYDKNVDYGSGGFRDNLRRNKGNVIGALIDEWLESGNLFGQEADFMQVLDMAGISQALIDRGLQQPYYKDPNYRDEKTYAVYMNLRNPFDTATADSALAESIEQWWSKQDQDKYERVSANADQWDKNNYSVERWLDNLRYDVKNGTTHAWTTVPDAITDYLKEQGYDGIQDTGGKMGGDIHTVYIPFSSNQIKSAVDNVGTFDANNNDIRYSMNPSVLSKMQQRDTDSAINYLAGQLVDNGPRAAEIAKALANMNQSASTGRATQGIRRDMGIFRKDRSSATQQNQRGDVQNPIQIMRDLTDSIRVGYNPGGQMSANGARVNSNVMGFYNERARAITTRTSEAGDLAIGLHEFGHAAQARLENLHANDAMLNALPTTVKQNYAQAELDGEAVAEFVVDYMYGRDRAVATAGEEYVRDFERQMRSDPELLKAVTRGRDQVTLWNTADTGTKIRAMMSETSAHKQRKGGISNLLSEINRQVFDYMAPAKQVSDELYEAAQWSASASKRADVVLTQNLIDPEGNIVGESLSQRLADAGATQEMYRDVAEYALARHAIDRDRAGKPVFDVHEITAQDLRNYVADVEAKHPEVVRAADAMVGFWQDFFDAWMVQTGMVNQTTVDTMRQMYPNYVPTFRVTDENFGKKNGAGSSFTLRAAKQGGSSLEVINPIYGITRMTQQVVNTVSQNQVARIFHEAMQQGDFGWLATREAADMRAVNVDTSKAEYALADLYENLAAGGADVDPTAFEDFYDTLASMRQSWTNTGWNKGANVISGVDADGKRFFYKIKDKGMYELLSGSANTMVLGSKLIVNAKNTFTRLTTSSNPFFALKNAARDFQVSVNTGTWAVTYADGAIKWARAFHEAIHKNKEFTEWRNMGGGEHTRLSSETGAKTRQLVDTLFKSQRRVTPSKIKDALIQTVTLEKFNNLIENTSRFAEYRFGRHDTSTFEGRREAFMASQDVTTNFATHGASALLRGINRIVPFCNATMQGLSKDINIIKNAFSKDGSVRARSWEAIGKTALNVGLTAALQAALIGAFSGGDNDDRTKEEYGMLSEEMSAGNLIIPIPKWLIGISGFDRPYIRIPIAQGPLTRSIYAAGLQIMSDVANMDEMSVDMHRTAQAILQDSLPDGSIFQALIDAKYNRTWYGSNIVSDYVLKRSVPNQYNNDTLEVFKGFSKLLYGIGIEVSPAVMQYVTEQYTGFAGKLIIPMLSGNRYTGERSFEQSLKNLGYSILKNYTIDPLTSTDLTNNYSAAKTIATAIQYDAQNGDPVLALSDLLTDAEREEAIEIATKLQKKGGVFYDADREIKEYWGEISNIRQSDLTDAEKGQQIREIRYDIDKVMKAALADWEEYKMYYIDHDTLAIAAAEAIRKGRP